MVMFQPLLGIIVLLALAWLMSERRAEVRLSHVVIGVAIQILLALSLVSHSSDARPL